METHFNLRETVELNTALPEPYLETAEHLYSHGSSDREFRSATSLEVSVSPSGIVLESDILRMPSESSVSLQNQLKIKARGLASEVHVNTNPVRSLFDVSRREETNTTGPSRLNKNIEN